MGLKTAIAGKVLGPRPGLAIISFFGGRVEIVLRVLTILFGSLPALIAAAIALDTVISIEITGGGDEIQELEDNTYAATGVVIGISAIGIIVETALIILRFVNIGLLNLKIKIFLTVDIVASCVLGVGHFVGGVLLAFYGAEWNDDNYDQLDDQDKIVNSMIAGAAFCFLATVLYALLAVFMIIFLLKDWNNKVVKATIKEAVTG